MKLILMADVHGNLPALRAAVDAIQREGYDLLVHLGDAIGIGPYPAECLDVLLNLPDICWVMGNHDAWFAEGVPDPQPDWMSDGEIAHQRWTHGQIDPALRAVVAGWPYLIQDEFAGVRVAFLHYGLELSGRNFVPIVREPPVEALDGMFARYGAALVGYGHHHPFMDMTGQARYLNPGSLGCYREPVARYTVVHCERGRIEVEHRRIEYEDRMLFAGFEARQVPEREFLYRAFFGGRFGSESLRLDNG